MNSTNTNKANSCQTSTSKTNMIKSMTFSNAAALTKLRYFTSVISANEPGRWVLRYSLPTTNENVGNNAIDIAAVLSPLDANIEVLNSSIVGPQVGQELADQGGLALLVSVLCIMAYLSFRLEWRLAGGSLLALLHDVLLVLAFFSLTQMEFNLTVLAAVMAVLGYSLNDSIVIADRIRE